VRGRWVRVRARRRSGWLREERLQTERLLEVNFVDVGQGDGCHIQTVEDRSLVIDAGEFDNMFRFLRWRFGRFENRFDFENFVFSHPDKDHYRGFNALLDHPNVHVGTIFHNSIVEQRSAGKDSLGSTRKVGNKTYITGLARDLDDVRAVTDSNARSGERMYPKLLRKAVSGGRVGDIVGLLASVAPEGVTFVPGYAPEDDRGMTLELIGPVPRDLGGGQLGLPRIGNVGETKNGHSVAIILRIGHVRLLLGGDLNEKSQRYLLEHYTGLSSRPKTVAEAELLVSEGRKRLEVDLAKACHHGSDHVEPSFLESTNPLATVISSGDDEAHSHPRPSTLGTIGKFSRGDRPLIFSTELARSGTESIKHPNQVRRELRADLAEQEAIIRDPLKTDEQKRRAEEKVEDLLQVIQRSVANYGMINVRTDGERMIVAQRLERKRSKSTRWDIYRFECDDFGRLHSLE